MWFNGISQGNSFEFFHWIGIGLRGALAGPNGQGRPPIRLDVKSTGSGFTCGWQLIDHLMPKWWVVESVKLSGYPKPAMALRSLWLGYGKKLWSLHLSSMVFRKKQVILEKQGSVVQCNQVIEGHCAKLTPCQGIVWLDTRRSGKSSVWTRTPDLSEENMNEYENIHPLLFGMISCLKNIHTRLQRVISLKLHPGRLTWNLLINHLERKMIWTKPPGNYVPY